MINGTQGKSIFQYGKIGKSHSWLQILLDHFLCSKARKTVIIYSLSPKLPVFSKAIIVK